jgi:hypothetical protein
MAIITEATTRHEIPHEPGEWVSLKKLSGSQMDEADQVNTAKVMERLGPILAALGPDARKEGQAQAADQDPSDIKSRRSGFDPGTLIKYALVGWSYPEEPDGNPADMLDAITRDWLWDTIILENTRSPESLPGGEPSSS